MSLPEQSFSEVNRKYWNAEADHVYGEEWIQQIGRQIAEFLQKNVAWIGLQPERAKEGSEFQGAPVSMLDYACGHGVASKLKALQALYPYVSTIRGIDVSDTMVESFNKAARLQGLSEKQMQAIQGDLGSPTAASTHPELQSEEFYGFHVIVISMALHHIENPQELLKKLVERLRDGGAIVVIDWVPGIGELKQEPASADAHDVTHDQGGHSSRHGHHSAAHTVAHVGFNENEMQKMLGEAGCSEVDYILHPKLSKVPPGIGDKKQLFFARGKK